MIGKSQKKIRIKSQGKRNMKVVLGFIEGILDISHLLAGKGDVEPFKSS
jgi:hypothetical protein